MFSSRRSVQFSSAKAVSVKTYVDGLLQSKLVKRFAAAEKKGKSNVSVSTKSEIAFQVSWQVLRAFSSSQASQESLQILYG